MKPLGILLIEDNAGDILLMRQALARESQPISVHVAIHGKQAVEMLAETGFRPDLIVLDLNAPALSGLSFLEWCKPKDVPVIVFSSSSDRRARDKALAMGAKEFVQKPNDLLEYRRVVSQMVRNWAHPLKFARAS